MKTVVTCVVIVGILVAWWNARPDDAPGILFLSFAVLGGLAYWWS